ncbi:MAG TPA: vWA domain-containing protein [Roseiflexaceae bacterium]|nr:vWA domain-containing protein [Roseiflexaceae bacterium]
MRTSPRFQDERRRALVLALVFCALLPLLAACGGSASPSGAYPTAAAQGEPKPAFSTAAAASGGAGRSDVAPAATAAAEPIAPPLADATAAPLAEAPPAGEAGGSAKDEAAARAPDSPGAIATSPTMPPLPTQPSVDQRQGSVAPLKAGDVNDNADFEGYRNYLRSFYSPPGRPVDVSERYILTVLNDQQQPVLDARVRVYDGDRQIFEGRTYAGGQTILFPRALGSSQGSSLRVMVAKGNSQAEGTIARGQGEYPTLVLPQAQAVPEQIRLDVMFLLDATGSMDDEIGRIQQTIDSIAQRIDGFTPRPALRFGLVAYRDRGEEYVTRVYDFTPDVVAFRKILMSVQAFGGGDEPEALNEALHAAIQQVNWADDAVRLTFLVADAPPHLDYPNDYDYVQEVRAAVERGVKIYPIAASNTNDDAEYVFRQLAQQTLAHFIFLTYQEGQNSGAPGETTQRDVDPSSFTVERLDDLVVEIIQRELASAVGAG